MCVTTESADIFLSQRGQFTLSVFPGVDFFFDSVAVGSNLEREGVMVDVVSWLFAVLASILN